MDAKGSPNMCSKQHRGERLTDKPDETSSRVHIHIYMYIHLFLFSSRLLQNGREDAADPGSHLRPVVAPATLALLGSPIGRPCLLHETHTVAASAASIVVSIVVIPLLGVAIRWRAGAQREPPEVLAALLREKDLLKPLGVSFFCCRKPAQPTVP